MSDPLRTITMLLTFVCSAFMGAAVEAGGHGSIEGYITIGLVVGGLFVLADRSIL